MLIENNIKNILGEIRIALLDADVALSVIDSFIDSVREKPFPALRSHS